MQTATIKNKIEYTVSLVSDFAKRHSLTTTEAFNYLDRFKAISFIDRQYNIAHTLPFDEMIDSLSLYCQKNGGRL